MVRGYHIIFTAYGFWLPNDPRGSWSDFVRSWELLKFGRATKVATRRSLAHDAHDRQQRLAAKQALKYPPVTFTGMQGREIARGFREAVRLGGYVIRACAIMPDHVHLVAGRDGRKAESIAAHFKRAASRQLRAAGVHPFQDQPNQRGELPPCWVRGEWRVFLNDDDDIARAIRYVEDNPVKDGLRPQRWSFVTPVVERADPVRRGRAHVAQTGSSAGRRPAAKLGRHGASHRDRVEARVSQSQGRNRPARSRSAADRARAIAHRTLRCLPHRGRFRQE